MSMSFWDGRSVFVTGHTGFKGSWLALWLQAAGARVHGFSLEAPTDPNLFGVARVEEGLASHVVGDIRDAQAVSAALRRAQPEVVFHLAAQSLVRRSYADPLETYGTNVMGTIGVLEAVRGCDSVKAAVSVTTDKCYENREWAWGYRETDALGGRDPYSSSKACAELVTAAYRDSFLAQAGVAVATARAGNVIGGGDWAADRLLPDFFRAVEVGTALEVRFPDATRPWQHVLEPLAGYLLLAERLLEHRDRYVGAWNFGPADDDARPVRWVLDRLAAQWPEASWRQQPGRHVHEAGMLKLDSSKARQELGWRPRWDLSTTLDMTLAWHRAKLDGRDMRATTLGQIAAYQAATPR